MRPIPIFIRSSLFSSRFDHFWFDVRSSLRRGEERVADKDSTRDTWDKWRRTRPRHVRIVPRRIIAHACAYVRKSRVGTWARASYPSSTFGVFSASPLCAASLNTWRGAARTCARRKDSSVFFTREAASHPAFARKVDAPVTICEPKSSRAYESPTVCR